MNFPLDFMDDFYYPKMNEIQDKILLLLKKRPMTNFEISHYLNIDVRNLVKFLHLLMKNDKILMIPNGVDFYKLKRKCYNPQALSNQVKKEVDSVFKLFGFSKEVFRNYLNFWREHNL